jgi:hypothetical protein
MSNVQAAGVRLPRYDFHRQNVPLRDAITIDRPDRVEGYEQVRLAHKP